VHPFIKLAVSGDSVGCDNAEALGILAPFSSMVDCAAGIPELFISDAGDGAEDNLLIETGDLLLLE
jgi:hypothetical protein